MNNVINVKINDQEVALKIKKPGLKETSEAKKVYNRAFSDAVNSKAPLRKSISKLLIEQGLWNDEQEEKVTNIQKEILDLEYKLKKGGIRKSQAREIAVSIKEKRGELASLLSLHNEYDGNTAEGQADDAYFNCLVALCTVYNTNNKPVFSNYEDYLDKSDEDYAIEAAKKLAQMVYKLDENYQENLEENVFLKNHGFVDEKYRLIDEKGRLISKDGRLIDENGYYVDEDGHRINISGHKVDKDGHIIVESLPFLDDDDNPIVDSPLEREVVEPPEPEVIEPETVKAPEPVEVNQD